MSGLEELQAQTSALGYGENAELVGAARDSVENARNQLQTVKERITELAGQLQTIRDALTETSGQLGQVHGTIDQAKTQLQSLS